MIFLMEEAGSSYETEGDFPAQVMMRYRKAVDAMESNIVNVFSAKSKAQALGPVQIAMHCTLCTALVNSPKLFKYVLIIQKNHAL